MPKNPSERRLGYRMPAEWEPHEATWIGWPHELTDWPGKFAPIPWVYAETVRHLARVERVRFLIVEDPPRKPKIPREVLEKSGASSTRLIFSACPPTADGRATSGPLLSSPRSLSESCHPE